MVTVILIGFPGGLITGVSPCVLPMLPVIFFAGGTVATERSAVGVAAALFFFALAGNRIGERLTAYRSRLGSSGWAAAC